MIPFPKYKKTFIKYSTASLASHADILRGSSYIPAPVWAKLSSEWEALLHLAWVSGVSGGKGKDGSEKRRELKERNFLSLLPLPHLKSPLP